MKQNILGQPPLSYKQKINRRIVICAALVGMTAALNMICIFLRTSQNHLWMLLSNIVTDSLCGCFVLYSLEMRILPGFRLYRLMTRTPAVFSGTVEQVNPTAIRYMHLNCCPVTVDGRKFFLPENTLTLESGRQYTLYLVSNIIVEVDP